CTSNSTCRRTAYSLIRPCPEMVRASLLKPARVTRISATPGPGWSCRVLPAATSARDSSRRNSLLPDTDSRTCCMPSGRLALRRRWKPQAARRNVAAATARRREIGFMGMSYHDVDDFARHDDDLAHRLAFHERLHGRQCHGL